MGSKLFLLACLLMLGTLNNELGDLGGDNAQYIFLAKSLATGQGYRTINEPGAPLHTTYPPGFPLFLTPIVALWGARAFLAMHLLIIAWAVLCLVLWFQWVRSEATPTVAVWSTVCLATTPLWVGSANRILSEFPYLAFSLAALLCVQRMEKRPGHPEPAVRPSTKPVLSLSKGSGRTVSRSERPSRRVNGLVLLLLAAYFTRTAGWTLIAGVLGWMAWDRSRGREGGGKKAAAHWKGPLSAALFLLAPILAWHLRGFFAQKGRAFFYVDQFLWKDPDGPDQGLLTVFSLWGRVIGNLQFYLQVLGEELVWPSTLFPPWVALCAGWILAAFILIGFVRRLRRSSAAEWYLIFYALLFWVWPYQESRFLLPVLPLLWLYGLEGAERMCRPFILRPSSGRTAESKRERFSARRIALALTAGNLAGCLFLIGMNLSGMHYPPALRGFLEAHDWLKANSSTEAVILSRKPTITALLSDRKAVRIPYTDDQKRFLSVLRERGVTHVLEDRFFWTTQRYLVPVIQGHLELFEPEVLRFGSATLLKLRGDQEGPGSSWIASSTSDRR